MLMTTIIGWPVLNIVSVTSALVLKNKFILFSCCVQISEGTFAYTKNFPKKKNKNFKKKIF